MTLDALIAEAMATAKRLNATLVRIEAAMVPAPNSTRYFTDGLAFWKFEDGNSFTRSGRTGWHPSMFPSPSALCSAGDEITETTAEHAEP